MYLLPFTFHSFTACPGEDIFCNIDFTKKQAGVWPIWGENWVLYGKGTGHHPAVLSFLYAAYPANTYNAIQVMHFWTVYQLSTTDKNLK